MQRSLVGSEMCIRDRGVDLVETPDENTFLKAINWEALKAGRSEDAIFEVSSRAS